jgi:hypothetical protein
MFYHEAARKLLTTFDLYIVEEYLEFYQNYGLVDLKNHISRSKVKVNDTAIRYLAYQIHQQSDLANYSDHVDVIWNCYAVSFLYNSLKLSFQDM